MFATARTAAHPATGNVHAGNAPDMNSSSSGATPLSACDHTRLSSSASCHVTSAPSLRARASSSSAASTSRVAMRFARSVTTARIAPSRPAGGLARHGAWLLEVPWRGEDVKDLQVCALIHLNACGSLLILQGLRRMTSMSAHHTHWLTRAE